MVEVIEKILSHNEHRGGGVGSISCTTLLGRSYKAKKEMLGIEDKDLVKDVSKSIGACLGTGLHLIMEKALKDDTGALTEMYEERIEDYTGVTITGTADIIYKVDGKKYLMDLKTTMFGKFSKQQQDKASMQMSIYRWLHKDKHEIEDTAYVLYAGRGKNIYGSIEVELMSLEHTERMIREKLIEIETINEPDCFLEKFKLCDYCTMKCDYRYKPNKGLEW